MQCIVLSNKKEANNAKLLRVIPDSKLEFIPGQFVLISYKDVKRAYSIASSPANIKYLEFAYDAKPNGYVSKYLYNLKKSNIIEISSARGKFTFDYSIKEPLVFIAGGTGIAPIISILKFIEENELKNDITLIYSCKTSKDVLYKRYLSKLSSKKLINYNLILTQEKNYKGISTRIDIELIKKIVDNINNKLFFLCGSPVMVSSLYKDLISENVPSSMIKIEAYD